MEEGSNSSVRPEISAMRSQKAINRGGQEKQLSIHGHVPILFRSGRKQRKHGSVSAVCCLP